MKKITKILCKIMPVVLVGLLIVSNVFGITWSNASDLSNGSVESIDNAAKKIWGSVSLILQILAVAAIVFAGVRYMFASANDKADIKKQTITLVVGAILVFAAGTIVSFITKTVNEVTT